MIGLFGICDGWRPAHNRFFGPPEWHWAKTGDVGGWVRDGGNRTLRGADGLRLEEGRAQGRLKVVKRAPPRVVYRVDLPGGPVYIKHSLVPTLRAMLRQWLRRGKGRNEGRRTRLL